MRKTDQTPEERPPPHIGIAASSAVTGRHSLVPGNILAVVEQAVREHLDWLARFHRVLICGVEPPRDIISEQSRYLSRFGAWVDAHREDQLVRQPVMQSLIELHDQMRDDASFLAQKNARGQKISEAEYELLSGKITAFFELAKRVQSAFHHARSDLDPLTGLHNRQVMATEVDRERERALRSATPCCLAIADIDRFKAINDQYGHAAGDRVLQAVALRLMAGCRPYDLVYRYGGEEFLICLPNAELTAGKAILDRLRTGIAESSIEIRTKSGKAVLTVTVSLGIVEFESGLSLKKAIERADKALYRAKKSGRNQVHTWLEVKRAAAANRPKKKPA